MIVLKSDTISPRNFEVQSLRGHFSLWPLAYRLSFICNYDLLLAICHLLIRLPTVLPFF